MRSPDLPFELVGGNDEQSALHNRAAAIDRIQYLTKIDLRKKSPIYLALLDMEMWHRWYKDSAPDKKIDEEFCQHAAEVVLAMEEDASLDIQEYEKARNEHKKRMETVNADQHVESGVENAGQTQQNASGLRESGADGNN